MIEVDALLFALLVEGLVVTSLATGVCLVLLTRRRSKDRESVHALAGALKESRPARRDTLRSFLADATGLDGAGLDEQAQALLAAEKHLYQYFARAVLGREVNAVLGFEGAVEQLLSPYHALSYGPPSQAVPAATTEGEAAPVPGADAVEDLRAENERLSGELRITMETLGKMLGEYAAMYGGGRASPAKLAGWVPPGVAAEPAHGALAVAGAASIDAQETASASEAPCPDDPDPLGDLDADTPEPELIVSGAHANRSHRRA